jgi:hypothetical protein
MCVTRSRKQVKVARVQQRLRAKCSDAADTNEQAGVCAKASWSRGACEGGDITLGR